nr:MAG TPA: hypothetical protein [Caudoviricetes sp.]
MSSPTISVNIKGFSSSYELTLYGSLYQLPSLEYA